MLRLVIHIECDECRERFYFARESAYTTDALSFNTNALTAMLPQCLWHVEKTDHLPLHWCQSCANEMRRPDDL